MLDTTTKKRIDDCRDTLVGKLPDPKAQIEQITIALIYKFMDDMDKEAIELGGKAKFFSGDYEKFSWDNLFDTKVTAAQMLQLYSEAIISMDKNPNIPQLFRDIFKNAFLPYRDPETLKLFLKIIGAFEYTHSEKLGDAFEYLLSVMGSQGDAGQFRTPRHIIDFLVKVVNPSKTDSILDPACGTAGFLISAFKHIMNGDGTDARSGVSTPDERKRLIQNFTGYDISPDMVRLSLVNLYLHGFSTPHIYEYDTLTSEDRWNDTYDVILANPPFMSPKGGIRPHKKFSVSSNRSEVLFVDYIAEHLNNKGRAGVIVPEGVIFQSGTAYKALRKMLVENYLYAVVSLPAGVFNPYSGVKTSILLMDKELAKKTNEILFVKIENDGFNLGAQRTPINGGQLEDAIQIIHSFVNNTSTCTPIASPSPRVNHSDAINRVSTAGASFSQPQYGDIAHAVPKSEIAKNGDYNLSGERYKTSSEFGQSDIDIVYLSEIADIEYGYTDTAKDSGNARFIRITDINESGRLKEDSPKYINLNKEAEKYLLKKEDILVARTGATFGKTLLFENDYPSVFASFLIRIKLDKKKILPKYYWAFAQSDVYWSQANKLVTGGGQPQFNGQAIKQIQIPLPPLSVQQEIVTEIEGYQKIIDGAKMVVENYKPKIEIDPQWEMVELGGIAVNLDSKRVPITKAIRDKGNYPYYGASGIVDYVADFIFDDELLLISEDGANLLARVTPIAFSISGKTWVNNHAHVLKFQNINTQKFVELYLNSISLDNYITGSAQPKLNQQALNSIKIPLPPSKIQHQIVSQIEKEQQLVASNKQLIEIFEQKIKDRIAKVWGDKEEKKYEIQEEKLLMVAENEKELM